MKNFVELLKNINLPKVKNLGGFFIGEKVLYTATLEKFVYICGDFVTASKLKKGLLSCNKKATIVSCGRENEDEKDVNLSLFANAVTSFLKGEIDALIFLPSSIETKFDLPFLKQEFSLVQGQEFSIEKLCSKLVEFGYERVDYVSATSQFAVRGDIVDVFVCGQEFPTRIEFFDEEIEIIKNFDFSDMKTVENIAT
ncbi:MAG: hypothetical protein K2K31_01305, partial [Clostridia bacterium]|nr:hypothetical protein [Clostridia bacterium]